MPSTRSLRWAGVKSGFDRLWVSSRSARMRRMISPSLLAHLKHSLLAAGGMGGIEEHRCVNRDFLFHDETISCH